jgi:hypothetical protein
LSRSPSRTDRPLERHVELGELDCKLDVPIRTAVIQTSLLVKLEGLIDQLKQKGLPGESLRIMSGFRTPDYNRTVGNETTWSRHLAGDAADVFVDKNGDDRMDDLNGDGRVNRRDARFLLGIVESMDESPEWQRPSRGRRLGLPRQHLAWALPPRGRPGLPARW